MTHRTITRYRMRPNQAGGYQRTGGSRITCGNPMPGWPTIHCTDTPHHYGVHDHGRTWWPNENYPWNAGHCTEPGCTFHGEHPGRCHIRPTTNREPEDVPF